MRTSRSALRAGVASACLDGGPPRSPPLPRPSGAARPSRGASVPDVRAGGGARGPFGRVRHPGPGRLPLGRHRRRALSLRRPSLPEVRPRRGLPRLRIYQLHETADGRLYVATGAGLARYQDGRFVVLGEQGRASAPSRSGTRASRRTRRARSTSAPTGASTAARTTVTSSTRRPTRSARAPSTAVHVDAAARSTSSRGGLLYRKESGRAVEFGRPRGLPSDETIDDVRDGSPQGRLWVRTVKHLYVLPGALSASSGTTRACPSRARSGRLGLRRRAARSSSRPCRVSPRGTGGPWRLIGRREGLALEAALSAIVDREGSLWIGLLGGGLDRRAGPRTVHELDARRRPVAGGRLGDRAARRPAGGPGPIWVGTEQGLDRIDPQTGEVRVYRTSRRPRRQHRQCARRGRGREPLGRAPGRAASRSSPPTGRSGAWPPDDVPPEQFRVAAIHVRARTGRSGSARSRGSTGCRPGRARDRSSGS